MRKTLRYLRIAWSVACGIGCLLFVALWMRSYWCYYLVGYEPANSASVGVFTANGATHFYVSDSQFNWTIGSAVGDWTLRSMPNDYTSDAPVLQRIFSGFKWNGFESWQVPDWFLVLVSATLATAPWFRWRFSLRTLLIAMTIIAVGSGLVVLL